MTAMADGAEEAQRPPHRPIPDHVGVEAYPVPTAPPGPALERGTAPLSPAATAASAGDGRGMGRGMDRRMDRRQFAFGGALLAAAAGTALLRPRRLAPRLPDGALDRAIPKQIGPYNFVTASGLVLPPTDEITERIYDQVLTRVYAADDRLQMMLLVAYGSAQDYTLQAHLPEICYPSSGYTLTGLDRLPIALRRGQHEKAVFLTAERADRIEQVFYWTRIGNRFPSTLTAERMAVVRANLAGELPDGILVRISTLTPDRAAALAQMEAFHADLIASVGPLGRRLMGIDV